MKKSVGAAVITKNHETYIEECIDSLLDQDQAIDLIVVFDDASEDNTFGKLQRYQHFKNIVIHRNSTSLGPSLNSNKALSSVNTDFVLYTSGDDVSKLDRARLQTRYLENTNKFCVINDVDYIIQDQKKYSDFTSTCKSTESVGLNLFKELFWQQNFLNASAACFSNNGNFEKLFNPNFLHLQDFDLWLRLSSKNQIISKPEKLLSYRILNTSLSQRVNNKLVDKSSMEAELFNTLFQNLSELSDFQFFETFSEFLNKYSNSNLSKNLSAEERTFMIYFLILSHNNSFLRSLAQSELQKKGLFDKFHLFVKSNFRT